jgi:hypothetical protein
MSLLKRRAAQISKSEKTIDAKSIEEKTESVEVKRKKIEESKEETSKGSKSKKNIISKIPPLKCPDCSKSEYWR